MHTSVIFLVALFLLYVAAEPAVDLESIKISATEQQWLQNSVGVSLVDLKGFSFISQ